MTNQQMVDKQLQSVDDIFFWLEKKYNFGLESIVEIRA